MLKSTRRCRKCADPIPNRVKINGLFRNIQNRKFCLKCSPFQKHNTRPDGPRKLSVVQRRERWCQYAKTALLKARQRKLELIALSGGKCTRCGYCRYAGSLEFHHRKRKTKKFELTITTLRYMNWKTILAEHAKCVLLCSNCHREVEAEARGELNWGVLAAA